MLSKSLMVRRRRYRYVRRKYNPWAVCKTQQKKYGWSKKKTERCIKKIKRRTRMAFRMKRKGKNVYDY